MILKYEKVLFESLEYIENNIKEDLTLEIIANKVGYSQFHFSRIFKETMGMSLMDYVKERRLICASREIFNGKKIIDVSQEYGYETHSGFSKAFKKKFGFTPTQHLIYAVNMIEYLKNENGDDFIMSDNLENANIFIRQTVDFKDKDVLYNELLDSMKKRYTSDELKIIEKAYHIACKAHEGQYRKSGEEYVTHSLCVSIILSEMELDKECIIAGLLHDIIWQNTEYTLEKAKIDFNEKVAQLIEESTKFDAINENTNIDIVMIKLADRLHNMRTIKYMEPERYKEKAKETIEIFSPIATKFNLTKIKTELDELALKYIVNS